MTPFEKAVEELMTELNREIGSGLLTHRALELMTPVHKWLELCKKLDREQAALEAYLISLSSTRPDGQQPESERTENGS